MDLQECRRLKVDPDININDLGYKFSRQLCILLDTNPETSNWKEFVVRACNFNPFYNFRLTDAGLLELSSNPSERMLWVLGSRGMKAYELVYLLDKMKLEIVLLDIKLYEPIQIINQPPRRQSVIERGTVEIMVEGKGFPYPRFQWFKLAKNHYEILKGKTSYTLRIESASQSDAGTYCCQLYNGNESDNVKRTDDTILTVIPSPISHPVDDTRTDRRLEKETNEELIYVRPGEQNTDETTFTDIARQNSEYVVKAKVALLIGNSDYLADESLSDVPKADLHLLTATFKQLSFRVFTLLNLTKTEMNSVVNQFIEYIKTIGNDVYVVFCFFGHGFEEAGKCYLVPTDACHSYGKDDCVCADDILGRLQHHIEPTMIVMVLDTCRIRNNNTESRRSNHQTSMTEPCEKGNTVVLYSTSKGLQAYQDRKNGFLAKYLSDQIGKQSDVIDVLIAVQKDIRREFHNRREVQIPEFRSNLWDNGRSFKDRIYGDFNDMSSISPWKSVFRPPHTREVLFTDIDIRLRIIFNADIINILQITIQWFPTDHHEKMPELQHMHLSMENMTTNLKIEKEGRDINCERFIINDLQKLQENLVVKVTIFCVKGNIPFKNSIRLNLKKPLIAALDLWKNNF